MEDNDAGGEPGAGAPAAIGPVLDQAQQWLSELAGPDGMLTLGQCQALVQSRSAPHDG